MYTAELETLDQFTGMDNLRVFRESKGYGDPYSLRATVCWIDKKTALISCVSIKKGSFLAMRRAITTVCHNAGATVVLYERIKPSGSTYIRMDARTGLKLPSPSPENKHEQSPIS